MHPWHPSSSDLHLLWEELRVVQLTDPEHSETATEETSVDSPIDDSAIVSKQDLAVSHTILKSSFDTRTMFAITSSYFRRRYSSTSASIPVYNQPNSREQEPNLARNQEIRIILQCSFKSSTIFIQEIKIHCRFPSSFLLINQHCRMHIN